MRTASSSDRQSVLAVKNINACDQANSLAPPSFGRADDNSATAVIAITSVAKARRTGGPLFPASMQRSRPWKRQRRATKKASAGSAQQGNDEDQLLAWQSCQDGICSTRRWRFRTGGSANTAPRPVIVAPSASPRRHCLNFSPGTRVPHCQPPRRSAIGSPAAFPLPTARPALLGPNRPGCAMLGCAEAPCALCLDTG